VFHLLLNIMLAFWQFCCTFCR